MERAATNSPLSDGMILIRYIFMMKSVLSHKTSQSVTSAKCKMKGPKQSSHFLIDVLLMHIRYIRSFFIKLILFLYS